MVEFVALLMVTAAEQRNVAFAGGGPSSAIAQRLSDLLLRQSIGQDAGETTADTKDRGAGSSAAGAAAMLVARCAGAEPVAALERFVI